MHLFGRWPTNPYPTEQCQSILQPEICNYILKKAEPESMGGAIHGRLK